MGRPAPQLVLGFETEAKDARAALQRWLQTRSWFAPDSLKRATVQKLQGVYVPGYLFSAVVRARYQASIGEEYQETETYTTTDSNGRRVVRTRTVTRTEWRPLSGEYCAQLVDVLVTASRGLPNEELERIEPFDYRALRRYSPAMISGWTAEEASLSLDEGLQLARNECEAGLPGRLAAFLPGDTHRDLSFSHQLEQEDLTPILLPVWVSAVRHSEDEPPLRLVVNGQSGEVHGKVPISALKVAVSLLTVVLAIGGLALLAIWLKDSL